MHTCGKYTRETLDWYGWLVSWPLAVLELLLFSPL